MFIAFRGDPVPCAMMVKKGEHCGKPSQAAEIETFLDADSTLITKPICRECAARLHALYSDLPILSEKPAALDLDTLRAVLAGRLGTEGAAELLEEIKASAQE